MRKITLALCAAGLFVLAPGIAAADGAAAFKKNCATCHGADGKGETAMGKKMKIAPLAGLAEDKIKAAIDGGVKREKDGVKQEMKPMKDKLGADYDAVVAFVKGLK